MIAISKQVKRYLNKGAATSSPYDRNSKGAATEKINVFPCF